MDNPSYFVSTAWSNPRRIAAMSILVALCLAIQLSPRPPNVEFTSFFTFIVGLVYGILGGIFFGCLIMFVNGFLSPYGFAGLNMPFQMVGMAIVGALGGIYRWRMPERKNSAGLCAETAIIGAVSAIIYDLITNIGAGLSFGLAEVDITVAILTAIAYGTFFSVIHVTSNTVVFGVLTLPSLSALNKLVKVMKNG